MSDGENPIWIVRPSPEYAEGVRFVPHPLENETDYGLLKRGWHIVVKVKGERMLVRPCRSEERPVF